MLGKLGRGLAAALLAPLAAAQVAAPPDGPRSVEPRWHALVHATLIPAPGVRIEDATIVVRDGIVTSVEAGGAVPAGATEHDCKGLVVHAAFVEPWAPVKVPRTDPGAPDAHWNPEVQAHRSALDGEGLDAETLETLRKEGFAAAAIVPEDGIFKGRAALVLLDDRGPAEGVPEDAVVARDVYFGLSLHGSGAGYPRSLMGAVALVRQTLLDAAWYERAHAVYAAHPRGQEPPPRCAALAALAPGTSRAPLFVETRDEIEALAASRIGREMDRRLVIVGSGTEFRRLDALADAGHVIVVPVAFPEPPDVSTLAAAERVSLRRLATWEQAPTNPRRLAAAGLPVVFSTVRLEDPGRFLEGVRRAVRYGLPEEEALAMLTTRTAELLGVADRLGTVETGKLANLVVTEGPLFDGRAIREVWVRGRRFEIHPPPAAVLGTWTASSGPFGEGRLRLTVQEKEVRLEIGDRKLDARAPRIHRDTVRFLVTREETGGVVVVEARAEGDRLVGRVTAPGGDPTPLEALRVEGPRPSRPDEKERASKPDPADDPASVPQDLAVPFGAFGRLKLPPQQDVLVTHATIWTCTDTGILHDAALLAVGGKIAYVGPAEGAPRTPTTRVIDARGKHVTPGLIDCHSHTGIHGGVNEGTQSVTAEVRIADVLDADDINWYRQLAGGVTTVNQLHGSANPIGGQNHVVKLRWGVRDPWEMRFEGAPAGIKLALGENVKRSNRTTPSTRYPASRMGVEALLRDRFFAARDYLRAWQRYRSLAPEERERTVPPRRDLELDALGEVLTGLRLVHCHSYRQDEILMLARVAREFGFRIGTYQHGLECYKVAGVVRESARGASIFSDWWAYKVEVFDAIPYAGAILHRAGVKVSFNSDSAELARRLNTEAAKAVKYGGVSRADALAFVTANPAWQLGISERVGALEVAKDADFVIWSGDPLSTTTRCEATFVDGREYFSLKTDRRLREQAHRERTRILEKLLRSKKKPERPKSTPAAQDDDNVRSCVHDVGEEAR